MFTATVSSAVSSAKSVSLTLPLAGNVSQEALPEIALLIDHGRRGAIFRGPVSRRRTAEEPPGSAYIRRWIIKEGNDDSEE
jgi:hypothetical protein